MPRPAQPDPTSTFGYQRLPPLHIPLRGNRNSQPAPWFINQPSRLSEDPPDLERDDHEGETPTTGHRKESHSRAKNITRDISPQECLVLNQNVQGLKGREKMEKTTKTMINQGIHEFCMQETWLLGSFYTTIRGHLLFHHGTKNKTIQRGQKRSGVAIIIALH